MRMLKRTATVLFLLVYFSSSFIMTQYRSGRLAQRVLRAAAGSLGAHVKNSTSPVDLYPRYREARKASFDFDFPPQIAINFSSHVGEREFALSPHLGEVCHSRRAASDRAPPVQA
jgi:hypothetical protein